MEPIEEQFERNHRIEQIEQLLGWDGHERLRVVPRKYPEAMTADEVFEVEVADLDKKSLDKLVITLVCNDFAVDRVTIRANDTTHLRVWSRKAESACSKQFEHVKSLLAGEFAFVDSWQWRSDDPRDLLFELPRRLDDECTWIAGAYFGESFRGYHDSLWNRGTLVVRFAGPNGSRAPEIALYWKENERVFKMEPYQSPKTATDTPPVLL